MINLLSSCDLASKIFLNNRFSEQKDVICILLVQLSFNILRVLNYIWLVIYLCDYIDGFIFSCFLVILESEASLWWLAGWLLLCRLIVSCLQG